MAKMNDILKENYELKQELKSMVSMVRKNESIYKGFRIVGFSLLVSDTVLEISDTALKYLEEIFNLDKAVIFFKEDSYEILGSVADDIARVKIVSVDAFRYTFLEKRIYNGKVDASIHEDFKVLEGDYSYILSPIKRDKDIIGAVGMYSLDEKRFVLEKNFDFINDLSIFTAISIKNLNNRYLLESSSDDNK